MTCEDGEGAVDLLGENDAGEFVRHSQRGERNLVLGPGAKVVREAFGVATKKNHFTRAAIAEVAQPAGKLLGGVLLTGGVEKDDRRRWIEFQFSQSSRRAVAQFADLEFGVAANACGIVVQERAAFFATRFAEHEKS